MFLKSNLIFYSLPKCKNNFGDENVSLAEVSLVMWGNEAKFLEISLQLRVYFCAPWIQGQHVPSSLWWCFYPLCAPRSPGTSPRVAAWTHMKPTPQDLSVWGQDRHQKRSFTDYSLSHQILKVTLRLCLDSILPSGNICQHFLETIFDCHKWGSTGGTQWLEARDIAKHPTMYWTAPNK